MEEDFSMATLIGVLLLFLPLFMTSFVLSGLTPMSWPLLWADFAILSPVLMGVLMAILWRSKIQEIDHGDLRDIAGVVAMWTLPTVCWWFVWAIFLGNVEPFSTGYEIFRLLIFASPVFLPMLLVLVALVIGKFRS